MSRLLQDEDKWAVVVLKKYANWTSIQIQEATGLSKSNVTKIWQKYLDIGTVNNQFQHCGGRNAKVTSEVEKEIIKTIGKDPMITSRQLSSHLSSTMEIEISDSSVRKTRKDLGFSGVRPFYVPSLTEDQKQNRIEYCETYLDDGFRNVMFVDESAVSLKEKGALVWYRPGVDEKPKKSLWRPLCFDYDGGRDLIQGKNRLVHIQSECYSAYLPRFPEGLCCTKRK